MTDSAVLDQIDGINIEALAKNPEIIDQALARQSFVDYISLVTTEPPPVKHHEILIDNLNKVANGEIKRLMVFMPPGGAKSTYGSILFPGYFMGRYPEKNIIGCSNTAELAERFSRKVRNTISTPEYRDIFGFGLSSDSSAAGRWENERGGEYFAAGVSGTITGRRGDLGLIDDPVKSREEADSEAIRKRQYEWYKADFRTRLKPNAAIVLIMTRWHELDLSGQILPEDYNGECGQIIAKDGETWTVISITALNDRDDDILKRKLGDTYWPGWFTTESLVQERISQGPRNWNALYQQRPAPEEGDFFKFDWIKYYDKIPPKLKIYAASDYAVTADGGDYTVHGIGGVDPEDNLYIVDWWRDRKDSAVWIEVLCDLILKYKPSEWGEEKGQISKSLGPFINKIQRERKAYCYRKQFSTAKNKPSRAQSIRGRMAQGKVFFPKNASWTSGLVSELISFPTGRNDDQVDVLSLFGQMLGEMVSYSKVPPPESTKWPLDMTFNQMRDKNRKRRVSKTRNYL
jgi:predicted phage terminase large subunit-like protein